MRRKNTRSQGGRMHGTRLHYKGWRDEEMGRKNKSKGQNRFGPLISRGNN